MGKTPSSHIIHSLGGEYCWIVRDSEPIRLFKWPRSLSVYILKKNCCFQSRRILALGILTSPLHFIFFIFLSILWCFSHPLVQGNCGKSKYKTKTFGMESDVARTTWKQWKWRCEDAGRLQTTSFVLRLTEPENGLNNNNHNNNNNLNIFIEDSCISFTKNCYQCRSCKKFKRKKIKMKKTKIIIKNKLK